MTVKSKKRLSNFLLSVFLILTAFDMSSLFLYDLLANYPFLVAFKTSSVLLQMPLFLLYVQSICNAGFRLELKHLLHTFPFLIYFFAALFAIEVIVQSYLVFSEVQFIVYILGVILILNRFKALYLEYYTNFDDRDYKWLMQITVVFLIAHIFVYLKLFSIHFGSSSLISIAQLIVTLSAFSVTSWLVMKALYKPEIFRGIESDLHSVNALVTNENKPNVVGKEDKRMLVEEYMEQNKPYLDAKLSIKQLAQQIGIQEKELSILINHHMDKHFFDFVNEYRIDKAKRILTDPSQSDLTILEILYPVGFNSKSSFNSAFKKYTHQTPSQYRKERFLRS
jgi:AraC-like DNA-binding protein